VNGLNPLRADAARMHRAWRLLPLGVALALTACASPNAAGQPQPPRSPAIAARPSARNAPLERQAHDLVNRYRKAHGLAPLALDERITEQARRHSAAMARGAAPIGHQGYETRIRALAKTMSFKRSAENVGFNEGFADPAATALHGWIASRTHRENLEGPYELTGVGVARGADGGVYFTQIFVGSR
jgi:uncharacterized protein YkwD